MHPMYLTVVPVLAGSRSLISLTNVQTNIHCGKCKEIASLCLKFKLPHSLEYSIIQATGIYGTSIILSLLTPLKLQNSTIANMFQCMSNSDYG